MKESHFILIAAGLAFATLCFVTHESVELDKARIQQNIQWNKIKKQKAIE